MTGNVDVRAGLTSRRLARLAREAVQRCSLDLRGERVLTEAATGPYVVTPVLAALAGAEVIALTRATRFGSVDDVAAVTMELAEAVGVAQRITIQTERTAEAFAWADIITNSGHVRPITGDVAAAIRPDAVIPLMFESWEARIGRLDLDADSLAARGVQIAGTNERHPHVDVFSYLGPMAVAQLADAGVSTYRGSVGVLCDNPFADYIRRGLVAVGAEVVVAETLAELLRTEVQPEALLVALTPTGQDVLSAADATIVAQRWPDIVVAQYWGDIDRSAFRDAGLACWPEEAPHSGHMGVLPSRVGPEPIIRLQAGGLKVGEVLRKKAVDRTSADLEYVDVF